MYQYSTDSEIKDDIWLNSGVVWHWQDTYYENNFPKQGEVACAPGNGLWPMKGLQSEQFVTLWLSTPSNLSKHCAHIKSYYNLSEEWGWGGAVGGTCNRLLPLLAAQMMRGRRGGRGGRKEGRRGVETEGGGERRERALRYCTVTGWLSMW